ncbi:hypothetical protein SAPIO_CDS1599 [Scedosporium apiospermum]|uniref:5'-nucleotidase n=1 Tax=Pseudallescheria apiosperma TaxID=563466 RepID=A0A084GEM8_PSEDA|nr:uncharacterized protein SAPIO_CDS1599 [Scedosporium apiospermum]KEZ45790.1 hypothetical protein SAPIO_CDS1599 [Scedosporium apiospermum]
MGKRAAPPPDSTVTYASGRAKDGTPPDLRIFHYNDVYHIDPSSAEPVGGIARFMTVLKEYRDGKQYRDQPELIPLFSGDVFNPSVESTVTKGSHMVPILNAIGTVCAALGNHDLDFGVQQFGHLASKCNFPWLIANVLDPALGECVPLGNAKATHMFTTSNGIKVGLIGLGEREWLETINVLPPNLVYKSATLTAKELVPKLREQGADIVIALTHMREPNDDKLARNTDGLIDIILGGHDHYYAHSFINGTHVLRSGSDFKQLSYIQAWRRPGEPGKWDFDILRRDVISTIPEDPATLKLVEDLTSKLKHSLAKPIGWTATPLDARFTTVRREESNLGNFVCDIMRHHYAAECALMAGGTIRGDQIYPPGAVRVKDIVTCFPFEDPVVLLRVKGKAIWDALENGRFPQVSNIQFEFNPNLPVGSRIVSVRINGEDIDFERKYLMATRGYMGRDGYTSLLVEEAGGEVEEIVSEENGILISAMLRQYFLALRTVGKWRYLDANHWDNVIGRCRRLSQHYELPPCVKPRQNSDARKEQRPGAWAAWLARRSGINVKPENDDSGFEEESESDGEDDKINDEVLLMRKYFGRWAAAANVTRVACDSVEAAEINVDWTRVIAPKLEGRIKKVE